VPRAERFLPRVDVFKDLSTFLQFDEKADDWREEARCRGRVTRHSDPWFATDHERVTSLGVGNEVALAHCAACPVDRECLTDSLGGQIVHHGNDLDRRRAIRRRPAEYGIFAGVLAHERVGKTADDVDELLAFAAERAVRLGLAPRTNP
jgi:hypothetical protein